ncbi:MAG: hypothetical protein ACLR9Q_17670 [Enterocloster sp.]
MKSIVENEPAEQCFMCGAWGQLERHHIFGAANRDWSEKYGLTVHLCPYCHRDNKEGVHNNARKMRRLQEAGQRAFERLHGHRRFMDIFKKNYLEGGEPEEPDTKATGLDGIVFLEGGEPEAIEPWEKWMMAEAVSIESRKEGGPVREIGRSRRGNRVYVYYVDESRRYWYATRFLTGDGEISEHMYIFGKDRRNRR